MSLGGSKLLLFISVIIQAGKTPPVGQKRGKQPNFKLQNKIDYVVAQEANIYIADSLCFTNRFISYDLYILKAYLGTLGTIL